MALASFSIGTGVLPFQGAWQIDFPACLTMALHMHVLSLLAVDFECMSSAYPLTGSRNEKGVHYAMELSCHQSDHYIWRYVMPDEQSLAEAIDDLE